MKTTDATTERIIAFLRSIGLRVEMAPVDGPTVLPGITVSAGALVIDPGRLRYPGDILHEAGHLAVVTAAERADLDHNVGQSPANEMMAIGWSYAAARHLDLPPEVVFHDDGYRGGSRSLLDNFAAGRYLAVPTLQWLGLTADERRAAELGVPPYPHMLRWLRD
ncbi:MAG: hypothetical protein ACJ74O_12985 [Frankiaceae bacterium]